MIKIEDKSKCCGCSACVSVCPKHCIAMEEDNEGFLYPQINTSSCIGCGLCKKVCPVLHRGENKQPLEIYAAKNRNESMRLASSSGGIFTLLAEKVLDEGGVVFGARFNENWEVIHDYTEMRSGLAAFRGSKYVQSKIGDSYIQVKSFLDADRKVLFTGTPCQIAGLKRYLRKEYDNLLAVDIICHGVPSPMVWRKYLDEVTQFKRSKIKEIRFRDKLTGWKNYRFLIKSIMDDKSENVSELISERGYSNKYISVFLADLSLRPSCYACPAKGGKSCSDITLGDYWGIEKFDSKFDDDKGCSVLLINSVKGSREYAALFSLQDALKTPYEVTLRGNPNIEKSATLALNRTFFFKELNKGFFVAEKSCTSILLYKRLQRLLFRKLSCCTRNFIF